MVSIAPETATEVVPTPLSHAVFVAKVMVHRLLRSLRNVGRAPRKLPMVGAAEFMVLAGESQSALWSDPHLAERRFEFGKVHNLRRACAALDGVVIPEGTEFSFWKQVGKASRRRGYVTGRMLQQGCLVPAVGGGLCQLSNALYDAALQAGCDITERHAHSRIVAGSAAAMGRDATIAWNYVDLRFRAPRELVLDAKLSTDTLIIRFRARERAEARHHAAEFVAGPITDVESCGTCDKSDCFRHEGKRDAVIGRKAFLVDECWPEFREFVEHERGGRDILGIPLNGMRLHAGRYRWDTQGFARVGTATFATLARSFAARRLKEQGADRRRAELAAAERLAKSLSRLLAPDVTEVIVAQSLLPFLWREGHLGGRRFSVLATRPPMPLLQARLDAAAKAHPERATLADFRADVHIVAAEKEAFAAAERVVAPHAELVAMFGVRAVRLEWSVPTIPEIQRDPLPRRIAFPGPTVARKGAHAVREAARTLDLEVLLLGSELEGEGFWSAVRTLRRRPDELPYTWLGSVAAVVQPALFEERPRLLLAALAAGVPVIATKGCGIAPRPGLTLVKPGDTGALIAALRVVLAKTGDERLSCIA